MTSTRISRNRWPALVRSAYPYRDLTREEFAVLRMLAEDFSTKRGRSGALIHHDAVNGRVRARRGARLLALTSGRDHWTDTFTTLDVSLEKVLTRLAESP